MKNLKSILLVIFVFISALNAQTIQWRWSRSKFYVSPEGNSIHFVGSAYLADFYERRGLVWWQADLASFWTGFAWEIKDGFLYHRTVPIIGSDGFSTMDIYVNILGIVSNRVLNITVEKFLRINKRNQKYIHDPGHFYY